MKFRNFANEQLISSIGARVRENIVERQTGSAHAIEIDGPWAKMRVTYSDPEGDNESQESRGDNYKDNVRSHNLSRVAASGTQGGTHCYVATNITHN